MSEEAGKEVGLHSLGVQQYLPGPQVLAMETSLKGLKILLPITWPPVDPDLRETVH